MMKRIFTCSVFVLGVVCHVQIVGAMCEALASMEKIDDNVDIYHCPSDDDFETLSETPDSNGSSGPSSNANQKLSDEEKEAWRTSYNSDIQKEYLKARYLFKENNVESAFADTFANEFSYFFQNCNDEKNIPEKARNLLRQNSAGKHLNVIGVVRELSKPSSCELFCTDADVVKEIKALIASKEIKIEKHHEYVFGGFLNGNETLGAKIKTAIEDRNAFARTLYRFLLDVDYVNEIRGGLQQKFFVEYSCVFSYLKNNLRSLIKFLGNRAFFNTSLINCSLNCSLAEHLGDLNELTEVENCIKFDGLSNRLYVDTPELMAALEAIQSESNPEEFNKNATIVAELILCYHQYLYEEFILSKEQKDIFFKRHLSPYERNNLKNNLSVGNISSLVTNGDRMKDISKVREDIMKGMSGSASIDYAYIDRVFIEAVKIALGISGTLNIEEIAAFGDVMRNEYLAYYNGTLTKELQLYSRLDAAVYDFGEVAKQAKKFNPTKDNDIKFSNQFRNAHKNILYPKKIKLVDPDMLRYLILCLDKEIKGNDPKSRDTIAGLAGCLMQCFCNCEQGMTETMISYCHSFLRGDPNITQTKDRFDLIVSLITNDIFNNVFSFRSIDFTIPEEAVMAKNTALHIFHGKYGLSIPPPMGDWFWGNCLFNYYRFILQKKEKSGTDQFVLDAFENLGGLLTERTFRSSDYQKKIVPKLAEFVFSPEVLVQKIVDSSMFPMVAELFAREISPDLKSRANWGDLDNDRKKQVALDMLAYYGYVTDQ